MNYQTKLTDPRWQRFRLQIFERDNWTCTNCGNTEQELHVHHEAYKGEPWEVPAEKAKTLCATCHKGKHVAKPALADLQQTRLELNDKIRISTNPHSINVWQQAVKIIDAQIAEHYPEKEVQNG